MLSGAKLPLAVAVAALGCALAVAQDAPSAVAVPGNSPNTVILKPVEKPPDANTPKVIVAKIKPADLENRGKLTEDTRRKLIQVIDAEFVHARKVLPRGGKNIVIDTDGTIKPGDAALFQAVQASGPVSKLGEKVQITNIIFHDKSIALEINGGPKSKNSKWYNHLSIGFGGAPVQDDQHKSPAMGATLTLEFKDHVPEMTAAELKEMVKPVLDFSVKSAAEVYEDTLPPKIRDAIKNHEVLVGMNHDMVVMAKDRPPQKDREKDEKGNEYEEWIYGRPPQDTVFVRFVGDEVMQVKIAKVSGEMIVKTQKEVDVKDGVATLAALKASSAPEDTAVKAADDATHAGEVQPEKRTQRPSLRRPGEAPEQGTGVPAMKQPSTQETQGERDQGQWGTDKDSQQPQPQPQPQPPSTGDQQQKPPQ